jgi:hypothetical protein
MNARAATESEPEWLRAGDNSGQNPQSTPLACREADR